MIKRMEAVETLYDLINSGVIDDGICDKLQDIALCIESELHGLHSWGADDDFSELHIVHRSDLITDELLEKLDTIHEKYRFEPSPFESDELKEYNENDFEEDEDL